MTAASLPVLDLADLGRPRAARPAHTGRKWVAGAALALLGACAAVWIVRPEQAPAPVVRIALTPAQRIASLTVDDRSQILAEGDTAQQRNAEIPFAAGAAVPMVAFHLAAPAPVAATALKCLTQAIYYEAATEPLEGRRAVAQVVLNRVRHPAYPKSVCGVVYQGAERTTGCQFSFTCDGSLLRTPMSRPWHEAEQIAREALGGKVEAMVGTATHYHADYVLPRWAFEMDKITQLGRHLFYRFDGGWGRRGFFAGAYDGREAIPALDFGRLRARLLAAQAGMPEVAETFAPGLTVAPHVTDRHADNDVGGRIDTTRAWRLDIPDPTAASSRYRALVSESPQGGAVAADQMATGATDKQAEVAQ